MRKNQDGVVASVKYDEETRAARSKVREAKRIHGGEATGVAATRSPSRGGRGRGGVLIFTHNRGGALSHDPEESIGRAIRDALDPSLAPAPIKHIVVAPSPSADRRGWMKWERDSWKRFRYARGACVRCQRTLIPKCKDGTLYRHHKTDADWCVAPEETP